MELYTKTFAQLTTVELYGIMKARQDIFIVEQNCIYPDLDEIDKIATHVFYKEGDEICAYARLYWEENQDNTVKLGRVIAVRRSVGLGLRLLEEAVSAAKALYRPKTILIHSQEYASGFYEKVGFVVGSAPFLEDGLNHVLMTLDFSQ